LYKLTVDGVFPQVGDFGDERQVVFPRTRLEKHAVPCVYGVPLHVTHARVTFPQHWCIVVLRQHNVNNIIMVVVINSNIITSHPRNRRRYCVHNTSETSRLTDTSEKRTFFCQRPIRILATTERVRYLEVQLRGDWWPFYNVYVYTE